MSNVAKSRRDLMVTASYGLMAAAAVAALSMAGCTTQTPDQLQNDVNLVVAGAQAVVSALAAVPNVPPAVIAQAQAALANIQLNAAAIANALSPQANAAQAIVVAVNTLATLVQPYFPQAGQYAAIVAAAVSLAAVIAGMVGAQAAPAPAGTPSMSPSTARTTLQSVKR